MNRNSSLLSCKSHSPALNHHTTCLKPNTLPTPRTKPFNLFLHTKAFVWSLYPGVDLVLISLSALLMLIWYAAKPTSHFVVFWMIVYPKVSAVCFMGMSHL